MNAMFFSNSDVTTLVAQVNQGIQDAGVAPGLIVDLRVSIKPTPEGSDEVEVLLMSAQPQPSAGRKPVFEIIHGTSETFPVRFEVFTRELRNRGQTIWHRAHCAGVRSNGVWTNLYAVVTFDAIN